MPEFLVERYVAGLDAATLATIAARLKRVTDELAAAGCEVRWLRSIALVEDETCFCLFSAAALRDVAAVNERAGLPYEAVAEVVSICGPPNDDDRSVQQITAQGARYAEAQQRMFDR